MHQALMPAIQRIRFNFWKHHLVWVRSQINNMLNVNDTEAVNSLIRLIKAINSNQVDIYTGVFSPDEIIEKIELELQRSGIFTQENTDAWLKDKDYQLLSLPDLSEWVLRKGIEEERYIHIHPARNSVNAVRIHGNSWKTAVMLKLLRIDNQTADLKLFNKIRKDYLALSPVKDLKSIDRLWKAIHLLEGRE